MILALEKVEIHSPQFVYTIWFHEFVLPVSSIFYNHSMI